MECKVCLDAYNDCEKRPRNLPCGHSFCSSCIEDLIRQGMLTCPNCRARHTCSDVTNFPFAYELEELINKMRMSTLGGRSREEERKIILIQEEQEALLKTSLSSCKDMLLELKKYKNSLGEWVVEHQDLVQELTALIKVNRSIQQLLRKEEECASVCLGEGEDKKQMLLLAEEALAAARMPQEVVGAIDDGECCRVAADDWAKKCQEVFPNVTAVYRSVKVRTSTKKALKMITQETGEDTSSPVLVSDDGGAVSILFGDPPAVIATGETETAAEPLPSILHRFHNLVGMEHLTVESLRELALPVRHLVECGQVVAIQHSLGHPRYARVSLHNDTLCLHHLQDNPPPTNTHIVPYNELLNHVDSASTLVFLEMSWPGSTLRRLYIRLSPDTPRGKQFRLLCTGEEGPSYASTRLLKVVNKGKPGECVRGGDYDNNDGTGGAAVIVGLTRGGEYMRSDNAGAVWGRWGDECRGGQFYITTRSRPGAALLTVFGQVESGLETLKSAVNLPDIGRMAVNDCGLVVPH
ncbi:uncharacterized protein LOC134776041 isoform X1 [Penaeus indicus]|uniref:uncharacterized protein LOC134776041 isoform X1 n=2 Tax=Penaeus indicus TaxID=29960 RepID=UPI00300C8F07